MNMKKKYITPMASVKDNECLTYIICNSPGIKGEGPHMPWGAKQRGDFYEDQGSNKDNDNFWNSNRFN